MPTCKIRNETFSHQMPAKVAGKWVKRIEGAIKATEQKASELKDASNDAEGAAITLWLLTHHKPKLAAVFTKAGQARWPERPTLEKCLEIANGLDLTKPIPEPVTFYAKKKVGKPGHRFIADFALQHRAAQRMVKTVLEVGFKPRPFQYGCAGKGLSGAIKQIRKQVAEGRCYFAHMDIESYFMNFDHEKLSVTLPLPTWAVEHVVSGRQMVWKHCGGRHAHSYADASDIIKGARRGIPQGSSVSSLIAMIECSKLGLTVSALFNYVDDFLTLAHTKEECQVAMTQLREAVEALPGGHFKLLTKSAGHLSEGCIFLGHRLRLLDGKLIVTPSTANYDRLLKKLDEIEVSYQDLKEPAWLAAASDCMSYLTQWAQAFSECDGLEERYLAPIRQNVSGLLENVGATLNDLKASGRKVRFNIGDHVLS